MNDDIGRQPKVVSSRIELHRVWWGSAHAFDITYTPRLSLLAAHFSRYYV